AGTVIRVEALLESTRDAPLATDLVVSIGGLEVGRLSHEFKAAAERWIPSIDVVPVGTPPWIVRAQAGPSAARTAVALRREPLAVLGDELQLARRRDANAGRREPVDRVARRLRGDYRRWPRATVRPGRAGARSVHARARRRGGIASGCAGGSRRGSRPDGTGDDRALARAPGKTGDTI